MRDHDDLEDTVYKLASASWRTGTYEDDPYKKQDVERMVEKGRLPPVIDKSRDDGEMNVDDYRTQIVVRILQEAIGKTEEEVEEMLEEQRNKEMPSLPSDGSKGQWRVVKKVKVKSLEWILEDDS